MSPRLTLRAAGVFEKNDGRMDGRTHTHPPRTRAAPYKVLVSCSCRYTRFSIFPASNIVLSQSFSISVAGSASIEASPYVIG